jgi:hypothetical protein
LLNKSPEPVLAATIIAQRTSPYSAIAYRHCLFLPEIPGRFFLARGNLFIVQNASISVVVSIIIAIMMVLVMIPMPGCHRYSSV